MKPAPFDCQAPGTLGEAIDLLVSNPEALVIAGGQSLMPVLAFRMATPSLLVDLRRLPGLGNIAVGDDGFRLGALVRWRDIENDRRLVAAHPLLHTAIAHVAHYQIRNRGTVGGSLAHADPAAELPGAAVTCEGEVPSSARPDQRMVRACDFFTGPLSTLRQLDEIVTELHLPKWPSGRRWAFQKYARREGDFVLAGILLFHDQDPQRVLSNPHVGVIGACPYPHRLTRVETLLNREWLVIQIS
jgi:carbon-monoxide dehydrogenase medium subunit